MLCTAATVNHPKLLTPPPSLVFSAQDHPILPLQHQPQLRQYSQYKRYLWPRLAGYRDRPGRSRWGAREGGWGKEGGTTPTRPRPLGFS